MLANTRRLKELLQLDVQYVIPVFQRPYVWNQDDQWEPLWNDIRNAAERYLDALASLDEDTEEREAQAEEITGSHFLGALVLQQLPRPAARIDARSVIDGQQRMTTLQLCLHGASNALRELGFVEEADRLGRLVRNQHATGDESFKVWPASLDQPSYRAVMIDHQAAPTDSRVSEAHEFFYTQVLEWIELAGTPARKSELVHGLETALLGLLELVVIDLGAKDDPFIIFETLNARGTPLIASDLVKNLVLQTAHEQRIDAQRLYKEKWKSLEEKWWRAEVRQGRLRRPRIDVFLNYWLIAETAEEVSADQVFARFRRLVKGSESKIGEIVDEVLRHAAIYQGWDAVDKWTPEGTFLYRWNVLDAGVSTPLLLVLYSRLREQPEELLATLAILESYLVRRMLTRMTTKDYNRLFLELVSQIEASADPIPVTMTRYLLASDAESRVWPDDETMNDLLAHLPLYRMLTRSRLRMVLEAIEESMLGPRSEAEHIRRGKLTIEHILPQGWRTHWPLPQTDDPDQAGSERDRLLHSIGNLTLVTKAMNPALSNGPWDAKRRELQKHSVLLLNAELLHAFDGEWFLEDRIRERSRLLAERICQIWPRGLAATVAADEPMP